MTNVPAAVVKNWELEPRAPDFKPIERDARRRMLLKLAALREAQRKVATVPPRSIPAGFPPSTLEIRSG